MKPTIIKGGDGFVLVCKTTVDENGVFTVTLPDVAKGFIDVLNGILHADRASPTRLYAQVDFGYRVKYYSAKSALLSQISGLLFQAAREHTAAEVTKELVIRYRYDARCTYAIAPDGTPFGSVADAEDNAHPGAEWANNTARPERQWNQSFAAMYVGLAAQVHEKTTSKRASSTTITYDYPDLPGSHMDYDTYGKRLNKLIGMSIDRHAGSDVKELPYTEKAAKFFYDFCMTLCKLDMRLSEVVGKDADTEHFIANYKEGSLLGFQGKK